MKMSIILITLIISVIGVKAQVKSRVSINLGTYYFYTPKSYDNQLTASISAGIRYKEHYQLSVGMDATKPYYDQHTFTAFYIEPAYVYKRELASPYFSIRLGNYHYINPIIGIMQHLKHHDIKFEISFKRHKHYELKWVEGFEMRLGIMF